MTENFINYIDFMSENFINYDIINHTKKATPQNSLPIIPYQCGHHVCAPSHSFGPAIRNHFLIHYIVKGKGFYHVDGKTYEVNANQGFLIEPGISTIYNASAIDPWEYYWIGFHGSDARRVLNSVNISMDNPVFNVENQEVMVKCLDQMLDLLKNGCSNQPMLMSLIYQFFSYLYIPKEMDSNNYIQKALEYIHNNYAYQITINDIAVSLSINRSYLYRLFMNNLNISPQQYLLNYRLRAAADLLMLNQYNISETAFSCGFNDLAHFSDIFKKKYGVSPSKYNKIKD